MNVKLLPQKRSRQEEFSWDNVVETIHIFTLSWQKIQGKRTRWYQTSYETTRHVEWRLIESLNIMTMAVWKTEPLGPSSSPWRILNSCLSFKSTILVNKQTYIQLLKLYPQSSPLLLPWAYSLTTLAVPPFHNSMYYGMSLPLNLRTSSMNFLRHYTYICGLVPCTKSFMPQQQITLEQSSLLLFVLLL